MNFRVIFFFLGLLSISMGVLMLPSMIVGLSYGDGSLVPLMEAAAAAVVGGGAMALPGWKKRGELFRREALAVVGLGWILAAAVGALPFHLSSEPQFFRYTDCYFESMSGLTTTGSTILVDIEIVPKGLLFWRSFLHWIGGMGIIVLFIAVLPFLGVGGKALYRSEVPGPVSDGLTPRIKQTAVALWRIYLGLTVLQTVALLFCGMNLFDSLCHTFATLGTGGFSTRNASVAAYDSVAIETIIIVFMILAGTNFSLHFQLLRGRFRSYFRDTEFRAYLGILAVAVAIITLNQWAILRQTFSEAFRGAAFIVPSIMTTTGFGTADYEHWTPASRAILLVLMFIGGCGGSTGGGIKVIRWVLLFKIARHNIIEAFTPHAVRQVKVGGVPVDEGIQRDVLVYFFLTIAVFLIATLMLAQLMPDHTLVTAATAVMTTLNNIGPGLEAVGPTVNFAFIPAAGKWLLSMCMVLGRLELLSVLVLVMPGYWSRR